MCASTGQCSYCWVHRGAGSIRQSCGTKIHKGSVRINSYGGALSAAGENQQRAFYHARCFVTNVLSRTAGSPFHTSDIPGYTALDASGKAELDACVSETSIASSGSKRKAKEREDEGEGERESAASKPPQAKKPRIAEDVGAHGAWNGAGQVVLFTGFRNAEMEAAVKSAGGSVAGSFTKAVNLLVIADAATENNKTKEARTKGIPIMTADEFTAACGAAPAGKAAAKTEASAAPVPAARKASKTSTKTPKDTALAVHEEEVDEDVDDDETMGVKPSAASRSRMVASKASTITTQAPAGGPGWSPEGQVVVFSGFRDKSFEAAITSGGGKVATSFTKAVTLVVSNDPDVQTGKVKEALSKGIRVMSASEFGALLHVAPSKPIKETPVPIPGAVGELSDEWSAKGQVVLFTGFRDARLEQSIRKAGGAIASSFTKAVTIVAAKDASVATGKVAEAMAKGIPVVNATSLALSLGVDVPAKIASSAVEHEDGTAAGGNADELGIRAVGRAGTRIPALVSALKLYVASPVAVRAACVSIIAALRSRNEMAAFRDAGGLAALADVLQRYLDVPDIITTACQAIVSAAANEQDEDVALAFRDANGIDLLVQVLQRYKDVPDVIEAVCHATASVMRVDSGDGWQEFRVLKGVDVLAHILQRHMGVSKIVSEACMALGNATRDDLAEAAFVMAGGIPLLVQAAERYMESEDVIASVCYATANTTSRVDSMRAFHQVGGIRLSVAFLGRYVGSEAVMGAACDLAGNVACHPYFEEAFATAGGIQHLLAVLHRHRDCARVMTSACLGVARLTATPANATAFRDANAIPALVDVVASLPGVDEVTESACIALKALTTSPESLLAFGEAGGMSCLLSIFGSSDNETVLTDACAVLANVCTNVENAIKLINRKGVNLLKKVSSKHENIVPSDLIAGLQTVAETCTFVDSLPKLHTFSELVEALQRSGSNSVIIAAACQAIRGAIHEGAGVGALKHGDSSGLLFVQLLGNFLNVPGAVEAAGIAAANMRRDVDIQPQEFGFHFIPLLVAVLGCQIDASAVMEHACAALRAVVCLPGNDKVFRECGGIPSLVAVLRRWRYNHDEMAEHACALLASITSVPDSVAACRDAGAIPNLVDILKYHDDSSGILEGACTALANLTDTPQSQAAFGATDGIDLIAAPEFLTPSKPPQLLTQICALLNNVTRNKANAVKFVGLEGFDLLRQIAAEHPHVVPADLLARLEPFAEKLNYAGALRRSIDSAAGVKAVCASIVSAMTSDKAMAAFNRADGMQALVDVLRRYVEVREVVEAACRALVVFDDATEASAAAFKAAGGLPLLVQVIARHTSSAPTIKAVCQALVTIGKYAANDVALCEVGMVPVLTLALHAHKGVVAVAGAVCAAIATIATEATVQQGAFLDPGLISLLVQLLRERASSAALVQSTCTALAALLSTTESQAAFGEEGGVSLLVAALSTYLRKEDVLEAVCSATRRVLCLAENEADFRKSGGIALIMKVLDQHNASSAITQQTCAAVANATMTEAGKFAFRDAGIIPALVSLLRTSPANEVREAGCRALINVMDTPESHNAFAAADGIAVLGTHIINSYCKANVLQQGCALLDIVTRDHADNAIKYLDIGGYYELKKVSSEHPGAVPPELLARFEAQAENTGFGAKLLCTKEEVAQQHTLSQQAYAKFSATATTLSNSRFVGMVGGYVQASTNSTVMEGQLAWTSASAPPTGKLVHLFSPCDGTGPQALRNPLINWHVQEAHVLESVRALMAPACNAVYANAVCVIQTEEHSSVQSVLQELSIEEPQAAAGLHIGLLVVLFDESGYIYMLDASTGERVGGIGLQWGKTSELSPPPGPQERNIPWLACRLNDSRQIFASGSAWAIVYKLSIIPAPRPLELASSVLDNPLLQNLKKLTESSDKPIGFFAQFAYAHTELVLLHGADDILRLLRGVDYIVATAAAALGMNVKAFAAIYHDTANAGSGSDDEDNEDEEDDDGDDDDCRGERKHDKRAAAKMPNALSFQFFRPLNIARSSEAAIGKEGPKPNSIQWLNTPAHREAGAVFDDDTDDDNGGGERAIAVKSALVLVLSKPTPSMKISKKTAAAASKQSVDFQHTLNHVMAESLWQCQGQSAIVGHQPITLAATTPTVSEIAFPFVDPETGAAQLHQFVAACQPAGFGRGSEAVIDPAIRKALALEASTLTLNWHPASAPILGMIQSSIAALMPPLRALLSKVNVYTKGHFFKRHLDTPRDAKMIGSLVVCLPAPHTGGELILRHEGKQVVVDWSQASASNVVRWCAFYSDVEHEVLPVRSGHRVTLTYDLVADGLPASVFNGEKDVDLDFSAAGQLPVVPHPLTSTISSSSRITQLVRETLRGVIGSSSYTWLGIFCSHAYPVTTNGPVDSKLLKGSDALLWAALTDEGWEMKLRPVYRCDRNETLAQETDPNAPPDDEEGDNDDPRTFERYRIGDTFETFIDKGEGSDSSDPEWDSLVDGTDAFQRGIVWLNKPAHLVASGGWDHMVGNFPYTIDVFYGTVAIFVRNPRVMDRAWGRRMAAVQAFAAAKSTL